VDFMRTYERLYGLRVLAYYIMSNHFHVLVEVPQRPSPDQLPSDAGLVGLVRATLGKKNACPLVKKTLVTLADFVTFLAFLPCAVLASRLRKATLSPITTAFRGW
jgi:hypothetical protein